MTNQELFDKVVAHLGKQRAKSESPSALHEDEDLLCMYRGPDGKMCAVGCLIPDDRYTPALEGKSVTNDLVAEAAGLKQEQICLAQLLQEIHDEGIVEDWPALLRSAATEYKLKYGAIRKAFKGL